MAKTVIFELKVLGTDEQIKTQNELTDAIKRTNAALKDAKLGGESYRALEKELANLKNAQKDVADSQRIMARELEAQGGATTRTYKAMNAQLVNLRAAFRELTEVERKGDLGAKIRKDIAALDSELKEIDASIGNFQRNVGNYEGAIKNAFAPIGQMLQNTVPGFQQLQAAGQLFKGGIEVIGTAASSTGKILTGAFIGLQVIALVLEGAKAIKEFTDETTKLRGEIGKLSNTSGEVLKTATANVLSIATTFSKAQNEIVAAANVVSRNFGTTFNQSLELIEQGFLAGADANGKFLDALVEMSPKAKGAKASVDQLFVALTQAGRAGLEEEEALEAIIRRGSEFTGTVGDMIRSTDALTQKQIEQLEAEKALNEAKVELSENLRSLTGISDNFFTNLKTKGIESINFVTKALGGLGRNFRAMFDLVAGIKRGAQSTAEVVGDRDAFERGDEPNQALTIAQGLTSRDLAAQAKTRADAAKKLREERQKLQAEANAAEAKYMEDRIGLLNILSEKLAAATIANIQDLTAREIAQEKARFDTLGKERAEQARAQEVAQLVARQKLAEAYGPNSPRVQAFDRQALADIQSRRELAAQSEQQQLFDHLLRLEQIRNAATIRTAEAEARRIQTGLASIRSAYQIAAQAQALELEQAVNGVLRSGLTQGKKDEIVLKLRLQADKSAIQQSSAQVIEEIERIQVRLEQIANDDTATTGSIAEYEQLTTQLDALLLAREKNEQAYTAIVQREAARRRDQQGRELEAALSYAAQTVAVFDQFAEASFQRELARIEEKEATNAASIESIEARMATATGFQKEQLQQQLDNERNKEKAIAAEKARLEKQEGQRAKAFAVIQSIINTALAVTKAFATVPPPANIAAAIFAGAAGAAQTAIIAAQPAAKGARIGSVEPVSTGLIVAPQNIPTLPNGDNVLATVKRGEVVLNESQQVALGGAPTFRSIGVPGFAGGGVIGEALGAPDLSGITNAERVKLLEDNLKQLTRQTEATEQRIDRIRTFVVSEDVANDIGEGNTIRTMATLAG